MPKVLTNLDLNKNEIQNVRVQNLATTPANPVAGQIYFNTTDNRLFVWTGSVWRGTDAADVDVYTHPNHSGDVTSVGDGATTIANDAVTNAKLANMATKTIKGNKEATTGDPQDLTKAEVLSLLNVQDGAQVNAVSSVNTKTGAVNLGKSDVGLANVTNDAQIKKATSSTSGNIPTWSGTAGDALGAGYSVETTLTGSGTAIARADAVKTYVDGLLGANDAMIFKGVISASSNPNYPAADAGHAYKISTAGKIGGASGTNVEVGDLIICIADGTATGTQASVGANWTIVQSNLDGAVVGPASAVGGRFASFDGVSGKLIGDSGYSHSSFASAAHNHDGYYPKKYSEAIGGHPSVVVEHNLGNRNLVATIREVASPYAVVYADIEFTSDTHATVRFATAPEGASLMITFIG